MKAQLTMSLKYKFTITLLALAVWSSLAQDGISSWPVLDACNLAPGCREVRTATDTTMVTYNSRLVYVRDAAYPESYTLNTANQRIHFTRLAVSLYANTAAFNPYPEAYTVSLRCQIRYAARSGGAERTATARLRINYSPESGASFQYVDTYYLEEVIWAKITVDSFGASIPFVTLPEESPFFLRAEIVSEQYTDPIPDNLLPSVAPAPPPRLSVSQNGGYIRVLLDPENRTASWAAYYDLEWVFVDGYGLPLEGIPQSLITPATTPTAPTDLRDRFRITGPVQVGRGDIVVRTNPGNNAPPPITFPNVPYDFRHNSTRVSIRQREYEIPLVFEKGLVIIRYRAVALYGNDFSQPRPGNWSKETTGEITLGGSNPLLSEGVVVIQGNLVHEQDRKNWQYIANYAENGLRKDVLSYFDGSLRDRQSITRLNTDGQHLVVGEKIYDHQGRPAISVLPAPYKPNQEQEVRLNEGLDATPGMSYTANASPATQAPVASTASSAPRSQKNKGRRRTTVAGGLAQLNSPSSANPQNSGITLMNWARPEITALGNIPYSGSGNLAPIIQVSPLIRALQYTLGATNQDLNASISRNTQFRDWSQYFDFQNPTPPATTAQPPSREWLRLESYLTQNPALRFQERFNVNSQGQPYSWRDFDIRREATPADCGAEALPPLVPPLGTQSGAGNYYSPDNPDQQGLQAFVPDAKGYPFVQTEFMPDPGSRVRRVGAPGLTHQLGNGHDKRFAYGVPAQAELDRWFGNDAGKAEHYQRVVMTDENGQQYIQYINPKGQVVGSGLLGPAPENLQALSRADQSVTLNVTEESRPQEADGFLVWSRTVTLSQPGNIQLDYAFEPALLDTALCNRNLCLSCIYDLEVELRNSCGEYLWRMRATLGNLAEIANCRISSLRRDTLLTGLPPGDYHLSKRLRVNEASVDAAVDQIMAANDCWRDNYAAPAQAPPCPAADDCISCQYEFEEITLPGMPISRVPLKRLPGNNPACARICFGPEDIPMPFDMNMYHRLVQDVSPGGQYGIIWTTRTISDGITERVPANDVLSVFSFNSQLTLADPGRTSPTGGLYYRNPVFPYRNADGSEAWVDVEGKIEGIDYYIESLRTDASGRRLIRPNDILTLDWLDAVWQDAWGESLVPYHPEYLYWVWAQHLASSESHNRQMEETVTFPPRYFPTPDGDYPAELFNEDPYFALYPDDVAAMRTALNAASRPVSGITYSAYQVAFATVSCGSPYFRENPAELSSCVGAGTEIRSRIQGLDLRTQAEVWEMFKQFYLQAKARLYDQRRDNLFTGLGLFNADYLGDPSCKSLVVVAEVLDPGQISAELAAAYRRSIPRFRRAHCTPNLPIDLDGDGRQDAYLPADNYAAIESWGDRQRGNFDAECRQCGGGEGLLGLLNALSQNNLLISNTPLVLPRGLDLPMPSDLAAALGSLQRTYEYKSSSAGNGELIISLTAGPNVTTIRLEPQGNEPGSQWLPGSPNTRNSLNWKKIRYFSCLKELKDKAKRPVRNVFYLEAYTDEGQKHIIHLHTTLPFNTCTRPETPRYNFTLRRNDNTAFIEALITYLFADPRRMREERIILPEFIRNLTDNPRMNTIMPTLRSGELLIEFRGSDCKIYVEVYDDSYDDKDKQPRVPYNMPSVVAVLPVYESTSPTSAFIVFMQDSDGRRFPLRGRIEKEDCLAVFDRVPGSPTRDCCLPILPVIRIPRYCDQQAVAYTRLDLANEQAIRAGEEIFERRAWRAWYLRRCQGNLDRLLIRYEAPVYQMTLFYYDQAGNRIRTVPPQGVRPLTDPQVAAVNRQENGPRVYPAHTMATTYRYNSLNQVVYRYAPDGGATRHAYDELGRVVLSQDAEQATRARAAYLRYDALGRLSESGFTNWEGPLPAAIAHRNFLERLRNQEEVFTTHYDRAAFADPALQGRFSGGQQHLRGRIASVSYRPGVGSAFQHATHYSYDRMGNMRELVQDFASLTTFFPTLAEHRYKQLRYDYDLITGNVNRMIYQPGFADQFVHWYDYDADNRVAAIYTAADPRTPVSLREREARYEYYRHGPQARITLGQDMVQGLDYLYTIHGWLKGINCPLPNPAADPGQDGRLSATAPDAYGYTLGYYAEDYRPIGLSRAGIDNEPVNFFRPDNGPLAALNTASPSLYNGNIRYTIHGNQGLSPGFQATAYRYDQIQRLVQSRVWQPPTTDPGFAGQGIPLALPAANYAALTQSDRWGMDLSYDANGNILTLNRTDDQGAPMDALVYHYPDPANNRLGHITDGVGRRLPASHPSPDLAGHTPGNYAYDAKGRLTQDRAEGNLRLEWSGTDKLKRLTKDGQELEFYYDALGRRTLKYNRSAGTATYYVRDARGEVLSTYTAAATGLRWDYLPIIGATRIGSFTPGLTLPAGNRPAQPDRSAGWRGRRAYELISQTGDVLALLSDRRLPNTTGAGARAEFLEAHDYYPFGMPQPDRRPTAPEQVQSTTSTRYPFGFQGMEMDSDYKGEGGAYTTEFRQYDARVGRWLSVEPLLDSFSYLSTYLFVNNNPIQMVDKKGDRFHTTIAGTGFRRSRSRMVLMGAVRSGAIGQNFHRGVNIYFNIHELYNDDTEGEAHSQMSSNRIQITIDDDIERSASSIYLAAVLIHELYHAGIYIRDHREGRTHTAEEHHAYMGSERFVRIQAERLRLYDRQINNITDRSGRIVVNGSERAYTSDQFYRALALGGLPSDLGEEEEALFQAIRQREATEGRLIDILRSPPPGSTRPPGVRHEW